MALHRGIQSALFYYLSCAPCTGWSYRKKRRKEADRDRAEKHQLEMEQPGLYRHPSPFATNPNWQTEIDLGPHPVPAKRKKGDRDARRKPARTLTGADDESNVASSVSLALVHGESNDSTWNLCKYQREDEGLWGSNLPSGTSRASGLEGSIINGKGTISRPPTARTARTDRTSTSYYSSNNPPINDLHPPIVTRLDKREDAMWMLQPPPPARVMAGKDRPSHHRNRSDSGSSRRSSRVGDPTSLSRQVSQRIIDEKLRNSRELLPAISLERDGGSRASTRPLAVPQDGNGLHTSSTENLSSDETRSRRRRRPPPINVSEDFQGSDRTALHRNTMHFEPTRQADSAAGLQRRRELSPIGSENAPSHRGLANTNMSRSRERQHPTATDSSDDGRTHHRPALSTKDRQDSSLHVLQELVPTSLLNARRPAKQPSFEARIELPSSDTIEEAELLGSGKATFDSWYETSDFAQFPDWVGERTKRDVTSRWSMDF